MGANKHELLVITGMSGAGRSTVGNALEDLGWYVVDNLPPQMLGPISDLFSLAATPLPKLAIVIDVRGGEFFSKLLENLNSLRLREDGLRLIFLEATDTALIKRFESVRRPHPLQGSGTLIDGITAERNQLLSVREAADVVIDTSELNIHQLSTQIADQFRLQGSKKLHVVVESFGFKYGTPTDADIIADARFIPNPFWDENLRPYNGLDPAVRDFVLGAKGASAFIENYVAALRPVFEGYASENKRYATIAIGCTGGKHRSVAVSTEISRLLEQFPDISVTLKHRDLGRE